MGVPMMPDIPESAGAISGMAPGIPSSDGQMPGDISLISNMTTGQSVEAMPNISMDGMPAGALMMDGAPPVMESSMNAS